MRWQQLLDALDVDELTEVFMSRVGHVAGYDPAPIPVAEVRRTGRSSFRTLIDGLRSGGFDGTVEVSVEVGVSRARAGIPLEALMTAIRHDFTVLWEGLTRVADESDAELVIRHTPIVLSTVDEYVSQAQSAYVAERARMIAEESSVRQGHIAALFRDPAPTDAELGTIAAGLGIDSGRELVVAAAAGDDIRALRILVSRSGLSGREVFTFHLGDALIAFLAGTPLDGALDPTGARLGLTTASSLPELRRSALTAIDLAHVLAPAETGPMTWERGWPRLAAHALETRGMPLLHDVDSALAACGHAERDRLVEAVRTYLRLGGIGETATALFCHRNTVANRLRRFAEVTGLDPLVPEQAARLVVGWAPLDDHGSTITAR